MKSPTEMFLSMLPNLLKGMGFEPDAVMAEFQKLRGTVGTIAAAAIQTFNGVCMANRRLARIEEALKLRDIEPVPEPIKAITHDENNDVRGDAGGTAVLVVPSSAR